MKEKKKLAKQPKVNVCSTTTTFLVDWGIGALGLPSLLSHSFNLFFHVHSSPCNWAGWAWPNMETPFCLFALGLLIDMDQVIKIMLQNPNYMEC